MRLIDADVLKQHIDKLPALPDGNFAGNHSALKALINMQQTIEPSTNCSEIPNGSDDTISRRAALDAIMGQPPEPHYPSWYAAQIEELPAVQPDHVADISKKAEGDCISRQEALKICCRYWHPTFNPIMEEIEKLPSVQPDRVIIDDCLHHIYKNISVHTATGGVIAIRYYMEKLYEEIYGEGERPWWMT